MANLADYSSGDGPKVISKIRAYIQLIMLPTERETTMIKILIATIFFLSGSMAMAQIGGRNDIKAVFLHINPGSNSNDRSETVKPNNGDVALSLEVRFANIPPQFIHVSKTAPSWYFEAVIACFKFYTMLQETKGNPSDQVLVTGGLIADSVLPGADRKNFNANNLGYTCGLFKN